MLKGRGFCGASAPGQESWGPLRIGLPPSSLPVSPSAALPSSVSFPVSHIPAPPLPLTLLHALPSLFLTLSPASRPGPKLVALAAGLCCTGTDTDPEPAGRGRASPQQGRQAGCTQSEPSPLAGPAKLL